MVTLTPSVGRQMDRVARRFGYRVFPDWVLHPSQIKEIESSDEMQSSSSVPEEAEDYLRATNPRLLELRKLYSGLDPDVGTPLLWTEKFAAKPNLIHFRGDNMWIHQRNSQYLHERTYSLATYYALANDRLGLMKTFSEDGAFGAVTFAVADQCVSRDLLDSSLEIDFLDRHLHLAGRKDYSILDIGAGYGRLAHRVMTAFPSWSMYRCTDVVAESSFVCEYYMRYRGLENRVKLVPATEIDRELSSTHIDLAINVHSFSECTLQAVGWWINRLANHGVTHLLIVPNAGNHGGQLLCNNVGEDMLPIVEKNRYKLIARESKYLDATVQKFGMNPTYYWLFEFEG